MRRIAVTGGLLFLAVVSWTAHQLPAQESTARLEVRFIDVGQADAILVRCPDGEHYLLIDAGDTRYPGSSAAFRAYLLREFEGKPKPWKIALVIASHPHADHIGSMQWVLENFDVETFVDNGQKFESTTWVNLDRVRRKQVERAELTYVNGKEVGRAELEFCPDPLVTVEILVPWAIRSLSDTNDRSVIVRLTYKDTSFLFVGDAEAHAEEVMLALEEELRQKLDVDVLKVGHHGSDTSSTSEFVVAVSPELAVVSSGKKGVGTNARYKHPRFSTLLTYTNWLKNRDGDAHPPNGRVWAFDAVRGRWRQHTRRAGLWMTPKDGTVIVRSDGETLALELEETIVQ